MSMSMSVDPVVIGRSDKSFAAAAQNAVDQWESQRGGPPEEPTRSRSSSCMPCTTRSATTCRVSEQAANERRVMAADKWRQSIKEAVEAAMERKPVGTTAVIEAIEVRKKNPLHEYRVILRPAGRPPETIQGGRAHGRYREGHHRHRPVAGELRQGRRRRGPGRRRKPCVGSTASDVISMSALVENERISMYRTTVNIAFAVER